MSYTVLARKYRPQRFSDVIGQEHVTRTLQNALEQQRIAHGYVFSGHRGIGKTTIARILAMSLNCKSADQPVTEPCGVCDSCREIKDGSVGAMDVIEIDAATNRGIEEVRGIIATATAEPARDRYRIFILDEAHQVTDAAFNALLKTLEEPPNWVVFMMCTTQPEDIPQTIRSRCQHFSFHAVKFDDIVKQLKGISEVEKLNIDDDALALLAEAGDGSMRDALSIMDQAIACCGTTITSDLVRSLVGSVNTEVLEQVMKAVHANSSEQVLRIVDKLLVEGNSPTHFARQFVRLLRNAIVAKVAGGETSLLQISSDERARVMRIAEMFSEEDLTRFLQIMLRTHGDVSYKQEQRFHLELGLLKLVQAQRLLPLEQLLSAAKLTDAPTQTQTPSSGMGGTPRVASPAASGRPSGPPSFARPAAPGAGPSGPGSTPGPFSSTRPPASRPSPFDADKARKSKPEMSSDSEVSGASTAPASAPVAAPSAPAFESRTPFAPSATSPVAAPPAFSKPAPVAATSTLSRPVSTGSPFAPASAPKPAVVAPSFAREAGAATALATAEPVVQPQEAPAPAMATETSSENSSDISAIRDAVLTAIEDGGWKTAAHTLEEGEWSISGTQLNIVVSISAGMITVMFANDQKKAAIAAATQVVGRTVKLNIVSGTPAKQPDSAPRRSSGGGGNLRGKAADEPIVKRMSEVFKAEIRTVIDNS